MSGSKYAGQRITGHLDITIINLYPSSYEETDDVLNQNNDLCVTGAENEKTHQSFDSVVADTVIGDDVMR